MILAPEFREALIASISFILGSAFVFSSQLVHSVSFFYTSLVVKFVLFFIVPFHKFKKRSVSDPRRDFQ